MGQEIEEVQTVIVTRIAIENEGNEYVDVESRTV
jgi:hypothetical protein